MLRSAAALPVGFSLGWRAGSRASVWLGVEDVPSRRWVERVLLPSYGHHRWRPLPEERSAASPAITPSETAWFAVPEGSGLGTLSQDDPRPWSEAVFRALPAVPAEATALWHFRAGGVGALPGRAPGALEPVRVPAGFRTRPLTRPEQEERDRRARRLRGAVWITDLRVEAAPPGSVTPRPLCSLIAVASGRDGDRRLRFRPSRWWRRRPPSFLLSDLEVAGTLPAPDTVFWPPPSIATGERGIEAGVDPAGRRIVLPVPAGEGRHLLVVGETGMGKSSLLLRLALDAATQGTVVLFDPIGDTGQRFLAGLPAPFSHRVVWISPNLSPVAIDLIAALRDGGAGSVSADRALSDVVDALRRVRAARFADTPFWGPRIEETVRGALRAAAAIPGATLEDADRLLGASTRNLPAVPPESREAVEALVARVRDRPEEVDGSRRLLRELTERPALRTMLGSGSSSFTVSQYHTPRSIVLISGDAPAIGESSARYLLAVHLALFWSSRQRITGPGKTFLILDEAQWYAHESLSEMLRLGRRSNLHVWLATQSLAALPEGVREAVRTNVADIAAFRGSPDDARDLARLSAAVSEERLAALPRGDAALLIGKGEQVGYVRTRGTPRVAPPQVREAEARAIAASRRFWPPSADVAPPDRAPTGRGGPLEAGTTQGPGAPLRGLVLVLWSGFLEGGDRTTLRVRLDLLRRECDPTGQAVRALGRRLRELDLIRASGRDADGAYWELARDGFDRLLGGGVGPEELERASSAWRRVRGFERLRS